MDPLKMLNTLITNMEQRMGKDHPNVKELRSKMEKSINDSLDKSLIHFKQLHPDAKLTKSDDELKLMLKKVMMNEPIAEHDFGKELKKLEEDICPKVMDYFLDLSNPIIENYSMTQSIDLHQTLLLLTGVRFLFEYLSKATHIKKQMTELSADGSYTAGKASIEALAGMVDDLFVEFRDLGLHTVINAR